MSMTHKVELVVSVVVFHNQECEPLLYTGWRLDRGFQKKDEPLFVTFPPPQDRRVDAPPSAASTSLQVVLDLDESRPTLPIHPDESNIDDESATIQQSQRECRSLYKKWLADTPENWFRVEMDMTQDGKPQSDWMDMSILVGLYGPWLAPSEKEHVFRLVEKRIDHVTLALGDVAEAMRDHNLSALHMVGQLSPRFKLGVVIDLSRSRIVGWGHDVQRVLTQHTLSALAAQLSREQVQEYANRMKHAREWAFRLSRLSNVKYYSLHPTCRMMMAEQTLRKFNASYFLTTAGEAHPGMRWIALQHENLTVLDTPTVVAWLRAILLLERIYFLPSECKTNALRLVTTKRLLAALAAFPARATVYLADMVDRCPPCMNAGAPRHVATAVSGVTATDAAAAATATRPSDIPVFSTSDALEPHASIETRRRRPHARSALFSHATCAGPMFHNDDNRIWESLHPASILEGKYTSHHASSSSSSPHKSRSLSSHMHIGPSTDHTVQHSSHRVVNKKDKRHHPELVFLLNKPSAFVGKNRPQSLRARLNPRAGRETTALDHKGADAIRTTTDTFDVSVGRLPSQKQLDQTYAIWNKTSCYRTLTPEESDTLFQAIYTTCQKKHILEQIDEYDGILDGMHQALTCNDCETQGYTCWRCHQSLRKFFEGTKASSLDTQSGLTELEREWFNELCKLVQTRDMHAVTLLCSIAASAMDDGGKRGTSDIVRSSGGGGTAAAGTIPMGGEDDILRNPAIRTSKQNLEREKRDEQTTTLPSMPALDGPHDGSTWSWWPDLDQTPYDTAHPKLVSRYRDTYLQSSSSSDGSRSATNYVAHKKKTSGIPPLSGKHHPAVLEAKKASNEPRYYSGERTDDSPDLGCHIVSVQIEWPDLHAKALCGIIVEQLIRTTGNQLPTPAHKQKLLATFRSIADRYKVNSKWRRDVDPALMLMECTEYSHVQQMGTETNGIGEPLANASELQFFQLFKSTFGERFALFLQRLPSQMTRQYDMYFSAMEVSSYALGELYGCGSWTWYDLETDRYGADFRRLFSYSRSGWMHSESGLNLVLRPSTPLMSEAALRAVKEALWPLERQMPVPPRLESVVHPCVTTPSNVTVRADVQRAREHCLFVNSIHWQTTDPRYKNTLEQAFIQWAQQQSIAFVQEQLQVHAYLSFVVLRITI